MGTSREFTNPAAPPGVSPSTPPQQYKTGMNPTKAAVLILASSSYCMHSHYSLNDDTTVPFWNLPLPMWNLDAVADQQTPQKKPRHQKAKKKAQPLKNHYTHAAFCCDPLCQYH